MAIVRLLGAEIDIILSLYVDSPWTEIARIAPNVQRPVVPQDGCSVELHRDIERPIDEDGRRELPARGVVEGKHHMVPGPRVEGCYRIRTKVGVCVACDPQRDAVGMWTQPGRWCTPHCCTPIALVKEATKTVEE